MNRLNNFQVNIVSNIESSGRMISPYTSHEKELGLNTISPPVEVWEQRLDSTSLIHPDINRTCNEDSGV
jgi:hypothetical protein